MSTHAGDPRLDLTVALVPGDAVAAIIIADGSYLLQLRDLRPEIFYPGCWGCFGGGIEQGESGHEALFRELKEELDFTPDPGRVSYFSRFDFDLRAVGVPPIYRTYYTIDVTRSDLEQLRLGEGTAMKLLPAEQILKGSVPLTPYDSFALWLHINAGRLKSSR